MKAPGSSVYVQQLELTIPRIQLELHLDQPIVVNGSEKAFGEFFDLRRLNRFDVCGGPTKFSRMLAHSSGNQGALRLSITKEGAVRVLLQAIPWNNLLDQNFFR